MHVIGPCRRNYFLVNTERITCYFSGTVEYDVNINEDVRFTKAKYFIRDQFLVSEGEQLSTPFW